MANLEQLKQKMRDASRYCDEATDYGRCVPIDTALAILEEAAKEHEDARLMLSAYRKSILDAEAAAEAAGRPEGEYLATSVKALAEAQESRWQRIESAPKNGNYNDVLLFNGEPVIGHYRDDADAWDSSEGWLQPQPTHWRPLPSPPEPEEIGE